MFTNPRIQEIEIRPASFTGRFEVRNLRSGESLPARNLESAVWKAEEMARHQGGILSILDVSGRLADRITIEPRFGCSRTGPRNFRTASNPVGLDA